VAEAKLPQPQSIQFRAKEVTSLRRRLEEANKLDTQTLERDRRDLAGARLVFYTNNDVERFLGSGLIRENFEGCGYPNTQGLLDYAVRFKCRLSSTMRGLKLRATSFTRNISGPDLVRGPWKSSRYPDSEIYPVELTIAAHFRQFTEPVQ
jgi:hypothetical protein